MTTDFCRLCALQVSTEFLRPINDPVLLLPEKLLRCCQLKLPANDERLPQNACDRCVQQLYSAWAFAESVAQAQDTLHKKLIISSVKKVPNSSHPGRKKKQAAVEDLYTQPPQIKEAIVILDRLCTRTPIEIKGEVEDDSSSHSLSIADAMDFGDSDREVNENETAASTSKTETDTTSDNGWKSITWRCLECDKLITNALCIQTHFTEHHAEAKLNIGCSYCPINVPRLNMWIKHTRIFHRNDLHLCCELCSEFTTDETAFTEHIISNHSKTGKRFICQTCGQIFAVRRELYFHQQRCGGDKRKDFICDICKSSYKTKGDLKKHLARHFKTHLFTCDQCGKNFDHKGTFRTHLYTHASTSEFPCTVCGKAFKSPYALSYHNNGVHLNIRKHKCTECGNSFKSKSYLTKHMSIHTGEMPFKCDSCEKCFRIREQLELHRRKHTGERPYACGECGLPYKDWSNYQRHMMRRHGVDIRKNPRVKVPAM